MKLTSNNINSVLSIVCNTPNIDDLDGTTEGMPVAIWGPPGTGKSSQVKRFAKSSGWHFISLSAATMSPSDALGIPFIDDDGDTVFGTPDWASEASSHTEGCVVLIDEIGSCPEAVQAALMEVVLERKTAQFKLPGHVRFVLCGNPADYAANGTDVAGPLANRMVHVEVPRPNAAAWCEYMLHGRGKVKPVAENPSKRIKAQFEQAMKTKAVPLMTSFIMRNASVLEDGCPEPNDPRMSRAWCSGRTAEMATNMVAVADILGVDDVTLDDLIGAVCGDAFAQGFAQFRTLGSLPDPIALLDGKEHFDHDPNRIDRTLVVMTSCITLLSDTACKNRKKRANVLWKIIRPISNVTADAVIPATRSLIKLNLMDCPEAGPTIQKFKKVYVAAGLIKA